MLDWLGWLADALLNAGADVASVFVSKDAPGFVLFQMAMATLVLAAVVSLIVYWQTLVEYWRSYRRPRA
ncbi:MAG TPA: hypothetical protein VEC94_17190 [Pseudolabrys sp.]|nr:hypothetical protein [Pseudolabrys sp.]